MLLHLSAAFWLQTTITVTDVICTTQAYLLRQHNCHLSTTWSSSRRLPYIYELHLVETHSSSFKYLYYGNSYIQNPSPLYLSCMFFNRFEYFCLCYLKICLGYPCYPFVSIIWIIIWNATMSIVTYLVGHSHTRYIPTRELPPHSERTDSVSRHARSQTQTSQVRMT